MLQAQRSIVHDTEGLRPLDKELPSAIMLVPLIPACLTLTFTWGS
jgi:hypothetical protein